MTILQGHAAHHLHGAEELEVHPRRLSCARPSLRSTRANRPNAELYSAAQSREQAGIVFKLACDMIKLNPLLFQTVQMQETAKTLRCAELGTRYRALSADANTAFALSPSLIIHDELGLVRGPRSPLYEALEVGDGGA